MMGFGLLWIVLFVVGLLFFTREGFGIRKMAGTTQSYRQIDRENEQNAINVLNERYARGEITREQYQVIKQDLD